MASPGRISGWFRPRYEIQQFALATDKQMPLGDQFAYRSLPTAIRSAARYQSITRHSYFRVLDRKTGRYHG